MDTFPVCSFPPATRHPMLAGLTVESGPALVGPGQTIDWSGGGWWLLELGAMTLRSPAQKRLWRALQLRLGGGATEIIVPFPFRDEAPWVDGRNPGRVTVPFGDGSHFSDGAEFRQASLDYVLAADLADGDTAIRIRRVAGADLTGGEFFTLDHTTAGPRIYAIEGVYPVDGQPDLFDVDFGPPARDPALTGDVADFENPRCVMKQTNAGDAWPTMNHGQVTTSAVAFVESFSYLDPTS